MTRLLYLGLAAALLPATGCVEDFQADSKVKPAGVAKPGPAPSPGDAKAENTPSAELPGLPARDPLVVEAVTAREQVARMEEELLERLDALRSVLASAMADPDRLRESVDQFLALTTEVRRKTEQAGDAVRAVEQKTADLSRSSRHLAASYRALADLYRRKARDYAEPKLRDQLLGFAADYEAVADGLPVRCQALDAAGTKLPALRRKVAEVDAFLGDAAAFLRSHPGVGAGQRERYAGEFAAFAVTVSEWLRVLDELRAALRGRAVSTAIQASVRKEAEDSEKEFAAKAADAAKAAGADRRAGPAAEAPKPEVPVGRSPGRSSESGQDGKPVGPRTVTQTVPTPTPVVPARARLPVVTPVPVVVTRCVPVLVPVTRYHTRPDWYGHPVTVATTCYEWRTQRVYVSGLPPTCR